MSARLRLVTDYTPLLGFFLAYKLYGLGVATLALVVLTAIALGLVYALERRVAMMPLASGVAVGLMGGLTLAFNNDIFIKMKPTLVSLVFALLLLVGFVRKKTTVKLVLGHAMQLTDEGWRQLSLRWGVFFLLLAVLNEIVWRNFSTEVWVNFKVFGLVGLSLAFSMLQMPFLKRHWLESDAAG